MVTRNDLANVAKMEAQRCFHGNVLQAETNLHPIIGLFPDWPVDNADNKWCSAFVYYCCVKAGFKFPFKPNGCCNPADIYSNLSNTTDWEAWAIFDSDIEYLPANEGGITPEAGDIVLYNKVFEGIDNDHMGIVIENKDVSMIAAEGNINNVSGVIERRKDCHIRAYIRLPAGYEYYVN